MKLFQIFFLLLAISACSQKRETLPGDTEWQKQMNADFKDATKSPLKEKDRKSFKGLQFFSFDSIYVVDAILTRTPDERPFKMKTTTDRLADYVKYGIVQFDIEGQSFKLDIYQNLGLMEKEGYEDYLFLPFLDNTNGKESYGGGRYVEARIPKGNNIVINFNEAYNPYCAYNDKYSCPIVPRNNYLNRKIEAGVKAYDKH